nr:hypothetical protein [Tanacetum cinerariifolium]
MMNEMVRIQLEVAAMEVNVQFLQQLQPEWSRFVTIVKQAHELDKVTYHKLFDILKQYQNKANEICAEKIARNTNPLALVTAAQHYPEYHNQACQASTRGFGHLAKECKKPKRAKDYAYYKEKMLLCKQEEKGVPLSADQGDWLNDTDEEPDDQELKVHYMYIEIFRRQHSEQPESVNDTYVAKMVDSNVIPDSSDICDNEGKADQNAKEYEDEHQVVQILSALRKLNLKNHVCIRSLMKEDDHANIFAPNREEILSLEQKSRSKLHKETAKKYDYTYQNSLYENFTPLTREYLDQLYYANDARKKTWRKYFVKYKPNIAKNIAWEIFMDNQWQQPTTQKIIVLVKNLLISLAIKSRENANEFENALKQEMFEDLEYVQSLEKEADELESENLNFQMNMIYFSKIGVSNDLTKSVTSHSWPQVKKTSFAKPYHVNALGPSRNSSKRMSFQSSKESVGSNDMVHNYYLEEAKKKAQL